MKETVRRTNCSDVNAADATADSETSLTLSDINHFHPYKKQDPSSSSSTTTTLTTSTRKNRVSLMNNHRIFASSNNIQFESIQSSPEFKKTVKTQYSTSNSNSQEEIKDKPIDRAETSIPDIPDEGDVLSKDVNLLILNQQLLLDCLDLDIQYDFDNSFSINVAAPLGGTTTISAVNNQQQPRQQQASATGNPSTTSPLKPKPLEPSIGWDENQFFCTTIAPIIPTSPPLQYTNNNDSSNNSSIQRREISTLELLLEKPLQNFLHSIENDKTNPQQQTEAAEQQQQQQFSL